MSVIAALVSSRGGAVGSDGRKLSPALRDGEILKVPPQIARDDFDKTFTFDKGRVIGAFCGLVEFDGLTVGQHIEEIAAPLFAQRVELATLTETLRRDLCTRLEHVNDCEVAFGFREVSLILVSGRGRPVAGKWIVAISFFPLNGKIQSTQQMILSDNVGNKYFLFGEAQAKDAARKAFQEEKRNSAAPIVLRDVVRAAIARGISNSGLSENGHDRACGGTIFTKRTP